MKTDLHNTNIHSVANLKEMQPLYLQILGTEFRKTTMAVLTRFVYYFVIFIFRLVKQYQIHILHAATADQLQGRDSDIIICEFQTVN